MLDELQRQLDQTYRLGVAPPLDDFLITDARVARCLGQDTLLAGSEETLFISEDEEGLAMSLYLDSAILERLESMRPLDGLSSDALADLWTVIEGLSHLTCMAFKADRNREVSLLELELQAEIDKFVLSAQLALRHDERALLRDLHERLFGDVRFHEQLDAEALQRYRAANDYASRYCFALRDALLAECESASDELRNFYRLPISEKISHIHSRQFRVTEIR